MSGSASLFTRTPGDTVWHWTNTSPHQPIILRVPWPRAGVKLGEDPLHYSVLRESCTTSCTCKGPHLALSLGVSPFNYLSLVEICCFSKSFPEQPYGFMAIHWFSFQKGQWIQPKIKFIKYVYFSGYHLYYMYVLHLLWFYRKNMQTFPFPLLWPAPLPGSRKPPVKYAAAAFGCNFDIFKTLCNWKDWECNYLMLSFRFS